MKVKNLFHIINRRIWEQITIITFNKFFLSIIKYHMIISINTNIGALFLAVIFLNFFARASHSSISIVSSYYLSWLSKAKNFISVSNFLPH